MVNGYWRLRFGVRSVVVIVVDNDWDNDYDNDGRTTTIATRIGTTMGERLTSTATITVYALTIGNAIQ